MRILTITFCLTATLLHGCALRSARNASQVTAADSNVGAFDAFLSKLVLDGLRGKTFESAQPTSGETQVKAQFVKKIFGKTFRQSVAATLLQTYDSKIQMPTDTENILFKVKELTRLGPRHYQMTATLLIKGMTVQGKYHAKLKQDLLGNPSIIDTDLAGLVDISGESTIAIQWKTNEKRAVVFDFVPLVQFVFGPNGEKISATPTNELERFDLSVDRLELEAGSLNHIVDTIHDAASETDAENLRNAVNNLCKDAANRGIQENKVSLNSNISKALTDANDSDKVMLEDFMSKLAVRMFLN